MNDNDVINGIVRKVLTAEEFKGELGDRIKERVESFLTPDALKMHLSNNWEYNSGTKAAIEDAINKVMVSLLSSEEVIENLRKDLDKAIKHKMEVLAEQKARELLIKNCDHDIEEDGYTVTCTKCAKVWETII